MKQEVFVQLVEGIARYVMAMTRQQINQDVGKTKS